MQDETIKEAVRDNYGKIAQEGSSCCTSNGCCGGQDADQVSKSLGYSQDEIAAVPQGANLGLGCGNPLALASLEQGETVLDLGSGPGFDCLLAAAQVGQSGRAIGVDMTPEMVSRARTNARQGNYNNVEFRLGEIEHLPVERDSIDVIISNCVVNLVPDKDQAFAEAFRVLRPGGRLLISDIVLEKQLPDFIRDSTEAYVGCVSGAVPKTSYLAALQQAGFQQVEVVDETSFPLDFLDSDANLSPETAKDKAPNISSIKVHAIKPNNN